MSLFTWLRERLAPSDPNPPRTLPKPVRVNLADIQRHDGHFVVVPEWSSLSPAPPRWEIPSAGPQVAWIDDLVAAHARAGTLDGLVPDLLDRAIAFTMDELRAQIDEAHVEGERLIQRLSEQARMAESALARKIHEQRNALVRAEVGYARAYEELTWELPPGADIDVLDAEPQVSKPGSLNGDEPLSDDEPYTKPHAV